MENSGNDGIVEADWTPIILRNRINGLNIKGTPKLSRSNREVLKIIYEICLEKDKERKDYKREKEINYNLDYPKRYFLFDNVKFCGELEKIEYKSKGVTVIYEKVYQLLESEGLKPKRFEKQQLPPATTTTSNENGSPLPYSAPSSPKISPHKAFGFHPYTKHQDDTKTSAQQMALIFQMEQAHKIINPQVIQVKPTLEVQIGPKLTPTQLSLKFQEEQALIILNHQKKLQESELNNFQATSPTFSLPSSIQSSPLFPTVQSLHQPQYQSTIPKPIQYQQYQQVQPNRLVINLSSSLSNTPTPSTQNSPIIANEAPFEQPKEVISEADDKEHNGIVRPTPLKYGPPKTQNELQLQPIQLNHISQSLSQPIQPLQRLFGF